MYKNLVITAVLGISGGVVSSFLKIDVVGLVFIGMMVAIVGVVLLFLWARLTPK